MRHMRHGIREAVTRADKPDLLLRTGDCRIDEIPRNAPPLRLRKEEHDAVELASLRLVDGLGKCRNQVDGELPAAVGNKRSFERKPRAEHADRDRIRSFVEALDDAVRAIVDVDGLTGTSFLSA